MKKQAILALTASVLLAGCGPASPAEPTASPVPTVAFAAEQTAAPTVLPTVEPMVTPELERVTVDTGDTGAEIWMEYPVFPETGEGYRRINAFFQTLATDFPKNEHVENALAYIAEAGEQAGNYYYERPAEVMLDDGKLVSVVIHYTWYMGGVSDYGMDAYTFSAETGELLSLSDVAEEDPEEIRSAVLAALREEDPAGESIDFDRAEAYAADNFRFYVVDGDGIVVTFNKYELADGAYGEFAIRPGLTVKDTWKEKTR